MTARKEIEEALAAERDLADRILDASPALIVLLDNNGRILRGNRSVDRMSARPSLELLGSSFVEAFVSDTNKVDVGVTMRAARDAGSQASFSTTLTDGENNVRRIEWRVDSFHYGATGLEGALAVGLDVTERYELDQRLRDAERSAHEQDRLAEIGAIAAEIVHDLGNPLTGISMLAQYLAKTARQRPETLLASASETFEQLLGEVRHLEALIKGFLDFARGQRLELSTVELADVLENATAAWLGIAAAQGTTLDLVIEDRDLRCRGDATQLRRVLDNLVKNALEALGSMGGSVRITLRAAEAGRFAIEVADSGPGVPQEFDAFRIFETSKLAGTGLGLAVSRQIVEGHGGEITLLPGSPMGTVATIRLPEAGRSP